MRSLIIIALLLISINANSQSVVKYRIFEAKSINKGEKSDPNEGWNKADILVVLESRKITVYSKTTLTIDLINNSKVYVNTKGDDEIDFSGVDDDGNRVNGWIIFYKDQSGLHVATMSVKFSEFTMYYRLKNS